MQLAVTQESYGWREQHFRSLRDWTNISETTTLLSWRKIASGRLHIVSAVSTFPLLGSIFCLHNLGISFIWRNIASGRQRIDSLGGYVYATLVMLSLSIRLMKDCTRVGRSSIAWRIITTIWDGLFIITLHCKCYLGVQKQVNNSIWGCHNSAIHTSEERLQQSRKRIA